MSDWIWVVITAVIVFLGISAMGSLGVRDSGHSPLQLSPAATTTGAKHSAAAAEPESPSASFGSNAAASPYKTQGTSRSIEAADIAFWAPVLLIPLVILLTRLARLLRTTWQSFRARPMGTPDG